MRLQQLQSFDEVRIRHRINAADIIDSFHSLKGECKIFICFRVRNTFEGVDFCQQASCEVHDFARQHSCIFSIDPSAEDMALNGVDPGQIMAVIIRANPISAHNAETALYRIQKHILRLNG